MSKEAEFVASLWNKLNEYLNKYAVNGHKLIAKPPNSVEIKGKVPDIVISDVKGVPQLIIETKRKVEGKPGENLLNPLGPVPIAQAVCYAALALEEYNLKRTPLFAVANKDSLILFKGIERDVLGEIVDTEKCLEPKRSAEDWVSALKQGGLAKLLDEYIVKRIEHPLRDESLKVLFEHVGKWLAGPNIPNAKFYSVFIEQLRSSIESLHEYVRSAVKNEILKNGEYFQRLFDKAVKAGYQYGLLSSGLLELRCPENSRVLCEYLKEKIEEGLAKTGKPKPEKVYELLSSLSGKGVKDLCDEVGKTKGIDTRYIPLCRESKKVEDLISFDNLTKMMTYVLANKILAYKVLELHYEGHIPQLKPVRLGEDVAVGSKKIRISSTSDVIEVLNSVFRLASSNIERAIGVKDFKPIFETGLYDEIVLGGAESINRVNALIDLADSWKEVLKSLPGIVGYVYENLLPPRERHQLGQFYTPPYIARLIVRWTVRSKDDRVLDGGCGSGTFLIEAYKRLLWLKFKKDYDKSEYPSCKEGYNENQEVLDQLYGVDINAFASHLAGIHLMLMEPGCPISKLHIYTNDYFALSRRMLGSSELSEGFDAVIGNPPYTRWVEVPEETRKLIEKQLSKELKDYDLKADVMRGREPGVYVYWVMHAAKNLLKDRGRIGMIISNTWLQTDYGVDFGKFLLDNFRLVALIDLSFRLFDALISTVILLAEKEPDENARNNNTVTLIRVPPGVGGGDLDAGKALESALGCVENSIKGDGSIDAEALARCREKHGIWFRQVRQGEMPRDRKWISLFFADVEDVVNTLKKLADEGKLMIRLGEWFEPSRGNSTYSVWALSHKKRPDLGAKDFFYFSEHKIDDWDTKIKGFRVAVKRYLVPAITRAQYIKTFTFTRGDWERIRKSDGGRRDAYILVLHEERGKLPEPLRKYVEWGEKECRTRIRGTRGGGKICSQAEACKARAKAGSEQFYGWYDLGGYEPTPLMAIRQSRYKPQFFLVDYPFVTYDAIIAFIPKVRITYPFEVKGEVKGDTTLGEKEVKALMAYLNSTFSWIWLEWNGRYIAKGPQGLEVSFVKLMPILNVKAIDQTRVNKLAQLFEELEDRARRLMTQPDSGEEDEEVGGTKLEMFKALKPHFQNIDREIAEILGITVDVEWLWTKAWEMMERRIEGAEGSARPGA
ncbi:HsdM family class I SAM-dependent methyltransferase, partial [Infirmifilum sp.]|uniref:HsdM family class I SAM-dependent methyltransferase n=1 Tax=Infirmifilum sp. TaxID=2856575 RepID=UPI003D134298